MSGAPEGVYVSVAEDDFDKETSLNGAKDAQPKEDPKQTKKVPVCSFSLAEG
jgi:hypothetical protein